MKFQRGDIVRFTAEAAAGAVRLEGAAAATSFFRVTSVRDDQVMVEPIVFRPDIERKTFPIWNDWLEHAELISLCQARMALDAVIQEELKKKVEG